MHLLRENSLRQQTVSRPEASNTAHAQLTVSVIKISGMEAIFFNVSEQI